MTAPIPANPPIERYSNEHVRFTRQHHPQGSSPRFDHRVHRVTGWCLLAGRSLMAEYTTPLGATRAKYRLIAATMPKRADRGDFTAMLADVVASADSIAEAESLR